MIDSVVTGLTVEMLQVGRIIGKGGQNVREMQRVTGAVIKLPEQVIKEGCDFIK